jgi:uroporphyrinogen decarboxylase
VVPVLADLLQRFRALDATTPVTYYSRGTGPAQWDQLVELPFQCLGIDWRHDMAQMLERYGERWCLQGNVDPEWLHLPTDELDRRLREWFKPLRALSPEQRRGWICGLGHGVLQRTPEVNVRRFIAIQRELFG